MATSIKWFASSLGAAFGVTLGLLASAAPGDLIYLENKAEQELTGPQALCFAQCAIDAGMWDGVKADMVRTCAYRTGSGGFAGFVQGLKSAPAANLPVNANGVQVVGIAQ